MKDKDHPSFRLDSFNLLNFILMHWRVYLITGIIAFAGSVVFSLLLTPKFSSELILYPSSNVSDPGANLYGKQASNTTFGDEEAVEKILQILRSDEIKSGLVRKYSLFDHYDIKPGEKYRYTKLDRMLDRNIDFDKTRFMSVRLTVMDEDPEMAAAMANDIASMIDSIFNRLIKSAGEKYLDVLERQHAEQLALIKSYEDSLNYLKREMQKRGGEYDMSASRVDNMAEYGPDFVRYSENHQFAIEDLGVIRQRLTEAGISASEDFSYALVVNEAQVAEKKSYPNRTLIVLLTTFSTLLFVLLIMIILEGFSAPGKRTE